MRTKNFLSAPHSGPHLSAKRKWCSALFFPLQSDAQSALRMPFLLCATKRSTLRVKVWKNAEQATLQKKRREEKTLL